MRAIRTRAKASNVIMAFLLGTALLIGIPASLGVGLACLAGYVWIAADRVGSLVFINSTEHEMTFRSGGLSRQIPPKGRLEVAPSENIDVFDIELTDEGTTWHYRLRPIDIRKYQYRARIYLQIGEDGRIYVLPHQVGQALGEPPEQPVGYPLEPEIDHVTIRENGGAHFTKAG
jgi:hypothetical protein